jgi:hypothetical protein
MVQILLFFIHVDFAQGVPSKALRVFGSIANAIDGNKPCLKSSDKECIF